MQRDGIRLQQAGKKIALVKHLQPGGVEDVYNLVGRNGARNDLPHGQLQFFRRFLAASLMLLAMENNSRIAGQKSFGYSPSKNEQQT